MYQNKKIVTESHASPCPHILVLSPLKFTPEVVTYDVYAWSLFIKSSNMYTATNGNAGTCLTSAVISTVQMRNKLLSWFERQVPGQFKSPPSKLL